jgi:hypothetical protein
MLAYRYLPAGILKEDWKTSGEWGGGIENSGLVIRLSKHTISCHSKCGPKGICWLMYWIFKIPAANGEEGVGSKKILALFLGCMAWHNM